MRISDWSSDVCSSDLGYWSRETGYEYSRSQVFGGLLRDTFADVENITKGLYAQLYYQLTDRLRAAGGFRYTWDTRNTVLHNRQIGRASCRERVCKYV